MTQLTHANSPLEQAGYHQRLNLIRSRRPLSLSDQAIVKRLLADKRYDYVHHELFDLSPAKAQKTVFDDAPPIKKPNTYWYHPVMDGLSDVRTNKPARTALLNAKQERALFLQFNYCRMRACNLRATLCEQGGIDPEAARKLLDWYQKAEAYRDQIAQTNLALVLAMAKRTRMREVDFSDLVSEGNMALLRAADKFDVARGFKFSTYACRAILKAFSRTAVKLSKYRQLFPTDFDPTMERSNHMELKRIQHEIHCVDEVRRIIRDNRAELSDIEQEVIVHRFAIRNMKTYSEDDRRPLTLEQVGKIIGVTKERVRQIQNKALDKLRVTLAEEFLE